MPYLMADEVATYYTPSGYEAVQLAHLTAVPDQDSEEVKALRVMAEHLVQVLHWFRTPRSDAIVVSLDKGFALRREDGRGMATAFFEQQLVDALGNVDALLLLKTAPRQANVGPLSAISNDLPGGTLAPHYRGLIESAAAFVGVASGGNTPAGGNNRTILESLSRVFTSEVSNLTSPDPEMRQRLRAVRQSIADDIAERYATAAGGNAENRRAAAGAKVGGFGSRVKEALDTDGGDRYVAAWKRFSNSTHGSVWWAQILLAQDGLDLSGYDHDRAVAQAQFTPEGDHAAAVGTVHDAVREMLWHAVRMLEPRRGPE
jgi:hypothetical protein